MNGGQKRVVQFSRKSNAMGILFNLFGLFVFWIGVSATTCTMCDTDSIGVAVLYSTPAYLISFVLLRKHTPKVAITTLMAMLLPGHMFQAWTAARISYVAFVQNGCICGAYRDYPVEALAKLTWFDYASGPVLLGTSVASILIISANVFRALLTKRGAVNDGT